MEKRKRAHAILHTLTHSRITYRATAQSTTCIVHRLSKQSRNENKAKTKPCRPTTVDDGSHNVSRWMTWLPISLKNAAKCDKWYQLQNLSITESLNANGAWKKTLVVQLQACHVSVSNKNQHKARTLTLSFVVCVLQQILCLAKKERRLFSPFFFCRCSGSCVLAFVSAIRSESSVVSPLSLFSEREWRKLFPVRKINKSSSGSRSS